MTAFLSLFRKDVLIFFSNRRALIMSFIAPVIMASFFGYVFGGGSSRPPSKVGVAWVDGDRSAVSQAIEKKLGAEAAIDLKPMERAPAAEGVKKGKINVAIVVPPGFGDQATKTMFRRGLEKPKLELLFDPASRIERQMVEGLLTGRVMEAVSQAAFSGASAERLADEAVADLDKQNVQAPWAKNLRELLKSVKGLNANVPAGAGGGLEVPFQIQAQSMAVGGGENLTGHYFSGMGVQFILFLGIDAGVALLLQRQRGLWKRFRTAPVSRYTLIGARAASAALFSLTVIAFLFTVARVVFGVRFEGSLPGFILVSIGIAIMTASYGLCIAAIGESPEAARPVATLVTLVLVMLGGSWIPTFLFPQWLQKATLVVPTRWAVDGLDAMTWRGLGFDQAVPAFGVLLAWAAVFVGIALYRFRWEEG